MQLDQTLIAIRERTVSETMDLALHVLRVYIRPLVITMLLGAVPLALLNEILIGWMVRPEAEVMDSELAAFGLARYFWTMAVLVYLELPLASVFATTYLGHAVFMDRPSLGSVVRDVLRVGPHILWYQFGCRGMLPGLLLVAAIDRRAEFSGAEGLLIVLLVAVCLRRAVRPFLGEIVLLERNPMRARPGNSMTIGRRSTLLHAPSGGDLMYRWLVTSLYATLLAVALLIAAPTLQGILFDQTSAGTATLRWWWPIVLWAVAGLFTVVRFLNYLDLRIRHEGWEVELRMRAEGARLTQSLSRGRVDLSKG